MTGLRDAVDRRRVDVAVVGAGISGLTAARRLRQAGVTTAVIEARARVGGRTVRVAAPDGAGYDGGGQFLRATQDRVLALVDELGLERDRVTTTGEFVRIKRGRRLTVGRPPLEDRESALRFEKARDELLDLAMSLSDASPWAHERAREWDSQTFRAWTLAHVPDEGAREVLESLLMATGAAEDVSFLHVLAFVRQRGGADGLEGSDDSFVLGGTFQIAERMAMELGDDVVLASPVRSIERSPADVVVRSHRVEVRADAVIVALAPPLIERIDFSPDLPPRRRLLQHRWNQMPSIKSIAVYPRPWWRERGLSGAALTDLPVASVMADASPSDGSAGVIIAFTNATSRLSGWVIDDAAKRRAHFFESITTAFGSGGPQPLAYLEGNWVASRWSYGCGQMLQCGVLTGFGEALRAPVGRVLWAGTETSVRWPTAIEGAVRAGEDAAHQARALLSRGDPHVTCA